MIWGLRYTSILLITATLFYTGYANDALYNFHLRYRQTHNWVDEINIPRMTALGTSLDAFHQNLTRHIFAENVDQNIIYSPISVTTLLTMTSLGAQKSTVQEILRTMNLPDTITIFRGFGSILNVFKQSNGVTVNMANKIYLSHAVNLNDDFSNLVEAFFESRPETLDFHDNNAVSTINNWCKRETNNQITQLITPGDLDNMKLILLNAIYFKGDWAMPFDPALTAPVQFRVNRIRSVQVPMMSVEGVFNYGEISIGEIKAKYIELPYETKGSDIEFSMFIIVPEEMSNLRNIEQNVNLIDFKNLGSKAATDEVQLLLPKFKVQSKLSIETALKSMGIREIFENSANLSKMSSDPVLFVNQIIQKAYIEVDEKGSVAAAATGVVLLSKIASPTITIDQPFLFAILLKNANIPLFYGRVVDPSEIK